MDLLHRKKVKSNLHQNGFNDVSHLDNEDVKKIEVEN